MREGKIHQLKLRIQAPYKVALFVTEGEKKLTRWCCGKASICSNGRLVDASLPLSISERVAFVSEVLSAQLLWNSLCSISKDYQSGEMGV
jgi:hypothetical protein